MFKPSNRTGGPRTDVLEIFIYLPYMDPRIAEERQRLTARSPTQLLDLLESSILGRSAAIKRSPSSPKKFVKDAVFLLRLRTQRIGHRTATIS